MLYFHKTTVAQTVNTLQYGISLITLELFLSLSWLSPWLSSWRLHFPTFHTGRQGHVTRFALQNVYQ